MTSKSRPKTTRTPAVHPLPPKKPAKTFMERLDDFFSHFKRFGWDLLGTFLSLVAILTLLGLLGLSRGSIINSWIMFLRKGFGWGSFLLVIVIGFLAVVVFLYSAGKRIPVSFGRILAYEGMMLVILPILSCINGASLERAADGLDGGTIGWGLSQIFAFFSSPVLALIIYLILFFVFAGIATGYSKELLKKIRSWSSIPVQPRIEKKHGPVNLASKAKAPGSALPRDEELVKMPQSTWRDDRLPPLNLLMNDHIVPPVEDKIKENARRIEQKLLEFGIPVKVVAFRFGPTVTQYAVEPGYTEKINPDGSVNRQKVKVSKITSLSRDLALALSAERLRIESPVPGRSYVGIEVPNEDNAFVRLRPILETEEYKLRKKPLMIGLGRDVSGEPVYADLEKLPHMLIAGTTNSGKSVCVTAITAGLVMNNTPADLRLVMLDPKMVELVRFNGLPHILGKVETEVDRMLAVLRWAQMEMDSRYRLLAEAKARNLEAYNMKMLQKKKPTLPRIVILIDELADLMMTAPDQTEHSLIRLAQMARATGMHLVVATQRPSTDIVTGLIKANFPARISFAMASSIDSRVILDTSGAEDLLGRGDMLFLDPQRSGLQRMQGIIVSDGEIEKILNHWARITNASKDESAPWEDLVEATGSPDGDKLIEQAINLVRTEGKASTSQLQRKLKIGFPRAARLIDELEDMGIVGPAVGSGKERKVLFDSEDEDAVESEDTQDN